MLSHYHSIHEKKEILTPVSLIPSGAVDAIQYLVKQVGLPPVKLPSVQDAEFVEVKENKKTKIKSKLSIVKLKNKLNYHHNH